MSAPQIFARFTMDFARITTPEHYPADDDEAAQWRFVMGALPIYRNKLRLPFLHRIVVVLLMRTLKDWLVPIENLELKLQKKEEDGELQPGEGAGAERGEVVEDAGVGRG